MKFLFSVRESRTEKCYLCAMKQHNGMRPQDIVILLKIVLLDGAHWQIRDLAFDLAISSSEVSVSLNRSRIAGLIDASGKKVHRQSLMEFIQYGLRYVFPQVPGTMVIGVPTAHSHPYYQKYFSSDVNYVWPDENGNMRGLAIQPLHAGVTKAVMRDEMLYRLLASLDIIRVGRKREVNFALKELKKYILPE